MNNKVLTVPNILTIFRIILIPVFVALFLTGQTVASFVVFITAGVTDVIDGFIARKFNLISNVGKVLDPLADKTLRMAAVLVFVITNILPLWILLVMLSFDLFLVITSILLYHKKYVVSSNVFGKLAGFSSMVALILCFFHNDIAPAHLIFVIISLVFIFVSIVSYFFKVKKEAKDIL